MSKYPHMKEAETELWDSFLAVMPWNPIKTSYDVRLGEGADVASDNPDWVKKMVWSLSTKRVDVLLETRQEILIIEVKERAAMSAVGQLLGYLALYVKQYQPRKPIRLVCVAHRVAPDMGVIFAEYGIEVYLV